MPVPETLSIGVTRPTFCPLAHLNKYFKGSQTEGTATGTATSAPVAGATAPSSDASSSSLVLGPSLLGRRDEDLARKVKEVHVVGATSTAKSPLKGRNTAVRETKVEQEEDLGNMSFGASTAEEESAEMSQDEEQSEPTGQLVQEEEEFVAFSGAYELPKKSKIGSKKRRAAAEAEVQAEEANEEVHEEVKGWVVVEKPSDEEVAAEEAVVEAPVAAVKGNKKAKKGAEAPVAVVVEKVEKVEKEVKGKKGKAAKGAIMSADAFFSPAGKTAAPATENNIESETDGDKPAKKSVKFSASNSVKLITPHKLPGFTNGIQDATTTEKSKSGPKFTKKAAGKKK